LQAKFREGKLRSECEAQMANVLREAALDYKLNPLLKSLCQEEVSSLSLMAKIKLIFLFQNIKE
jgi:Golgi apparatus protein 1